jgi:two-component system chemotaxis sensor kinase CheA
VIGQGGMAERFSGPDDIAVPVARLWSLPAALAHLRTFVADRAGGVGKSATLSVHCPPILVRQPVIDAVIPTLVQLLRNAVEHGVETPTERLVAAKSLEAALTITVTAEDDQLIIAVDDDGRGIEGSRAGALAADDNLVATPDALHAVAGDAWRALLLRQGLAVDGDSGRRAFGLKRAAARLSGIRGQISFRTRPGLGTTFRVTIPIGSRDDVVIANPASQWLAGDAVPATSDLGEG